MNVEMHANAIRWQATEATVRELVLAKFGRWQTAVSRIAVHLTDLNGPKGGTDADCLVRVTLHRRPAIVVRKRSDNVLAALHNCLDRAVRSMIRVTRRRARNRRKGFDRSIDDRQMPI